MAQWIKFITILKGLSDEKTYFSSINDCVIFLCGFKFPESVCHEHKVDESLCQRNIVAGDILKANISQSKKIKLLNLLLKEQILESSLSEQHAKEFLVTQKILVDMSMKAAENLQKQIRSKKKRTNFGLIEVKTMVLGKVDKDQLVKIQPNHCTLEKTRVFATANGSQKFK